MLREQDVKEINEAIKVVKQCRELGVKGRKDIDFDSGTSISVYHLGNTNSTIRIDVKEA